MPLIAGSVAGAADRHMGVAWFIEDLGDVAGWGSATVVPRTCGCCVCVHRVASFAVGVVAGFLAFLLLFSRVTSHGSNCGTVLSPEEAARD